MASPLRASLALCLGLMAFSLAAQPKPGIDPANLDMALKPCEDFYAYANGGWLKAHSIPADKARYGAFEEVSERNRAILKQILEETSAKTTWAKGSVEQKVGDFFASGMDESAIDKRGLAPLKPVFASIEGLKDSKQLPALLAKLHTQGLPGAFGFFVSQDARKSTRYMGILSQGGTGQRPPLQPARVLRSLRLRRWPAHEARREAPAGHLVVHCSGMLCIPEIERKDLS